jgi:NitT/TauT family transport system ATP-binding protein
MNKIVEMKNITKSYASLKVLEEASFHIERGEIVCLLGPSGCGKSTLFKILAGLEEEDSGVVNIKPEIRTGYVFQKPRLLPWKTVEENLEFVQNNYLKSDRAREIRENLLELNGLGNFKGSYPSQLSGGMKQRVEIIRGLSIWPKLLLMDEPFKSVDTQMKLNLREMVLRFVEREGLSALLITHDPEEAVLTADRIYILSGQPGKMIEEYKINTPRAERSLKNIDLYNIIQEIIHIFRQLVDDYCWEDNKKTDLILKQLRR